MGYPRPLSEALIVSYRTVFHCVGLHAELVPPEEVSISQPVYRQQEHTIERSSVGFGCFLGRQQRRRGYWWLQIE